LIGRCTGQLGGPPPHALPSGSGGANAPRRDASTGGRDNVRVIPALQATAPGFRGRNRGHSSVTIVIWCGTVSPGGAGGRCVLRTHSLVADPREKAIPGERAFRPNAIILNHIYDLFNITTK